jgi:hypothetical protein
MTETLRTVAETAVCRTCDFQVTAFSSRIALQRAGNTSRITLSSSLLGGRHAFRARLAAVGYPFVVPVMWLEHA